MGVRRHLGGLPPVVGVLLGWTLAPAPPGRTLGRVMLGGLTIGGAAGFLAIHAFLSSLSCFQRSLRNAGSRREVPPWRGRT